MPKLGTELERSFFFFFDCAAWHVGLSSLIRDQTHALCIASAEPGKSKILVLHDLTNSAIKVYGLPWWTSG